MLRKTLNLILIVFSFTLTGLFTSFFFIGSEFTYERQLQDLPNYFIRRLLGGISVGLLCCGILVLLNFILNKTLKDDKVKLVKLFLFTLLTTSIASIIGTIVFFSH